MLGRNVGLVLLLLVSLVSVVSAYEYPYDPYKTYDNPNLFPASCLDKVNNDPPQGDLRVDCADRFPDGARSCPADLYHPKPCPNGEQVVCSWDSYDQGYADYDGVYKAGWICPKGKKAELPTYTPTYAPEATYAPEPTYEPSYDYYGADVWTPAPEPAYGVCGDGICQYGESCLSDCGYNYDYYGYGYGGYGYGGYDYCYVNAPYYGYTGQLTPIQIQYYGYAPYSAQIDCGDGSIATAYANGLYGYNYGGGSVFYGYCQYTYSGIFFPRAYAGAAVCSPGQISVRDGGGYGPYPTYYPTYGPTYQPTYTPTYQPSEPYVSMLFPRGGESFKAGQTITVQWQGMNVNHYEVWYSTDGGASWQILRSHPYLQTSVNWKIPDVESGEVRVGVDGMNANHDVIAQDESGDFSVQRSQPGCALTAFPASIKEGDSSIVSVSYFELGREPNSVTVDCGNGATKNAVSCTGTTGSCSVFCNYQAKGSFTALASVEGNACSPATISVGENAANRCSDGTAFGQCSVNKPKYCDDGLLIDKASACGCGDGKVKSGERCVSPTASCSVTLNPSTVRANEQANVLINYNGISFQTGDKAEVVCGNGMTEIASCTPSAELAGSCIASCAYGEESAYPRNFVVNAFVKGSACSSANLQVVAPSETTGSLLAKVSDCNSGAALQHATVRIANKPDFFTDANGQLKVSLDPGAYTLKVSKTDYLGGSASVEIQKGKISTSEACLKPVGCDVSAELVRTPDANDASNPLLYQIRITNNLKSGNTVEIAYSSAAIVSGPTSLTLKALESRIINVYVFASRDLVGKTLGSVSIRGKGSCVKNLELPVNLAGGLTIEVQQPVKETFPGKNVCFDLLVRNRGNNEGTVTLSYTGKFDADFNVPQFFLTSQEIRDDLQFCVDVPSGESGSGTFDLRALSAFSDGRSSVTVKILDSGDFETDIEDSCLLIRDSGELHPITIDNDVADGDYAVMLRDNSVNARVSPSVLYNFKKGTSRTVYISASPKNFDSADAFVELILKRDSQIALQKDICLSTSRISRREIFTQLSQSILQLQRGGSVSTVLTIKNVGTIGDDYFIRVESPLTVSVSETSFYLEPNEEKRITVRFSAANDAAAKRYSIPIRIYSGRGSGGVVYDGNTGGNTAFIECGNGKTLALQCEEGSSSCSASCRYEDTGSYTVRANVGNQKCEESNVRVIIPDGLSACAVATESFVREDGSVTAKVKYNNLPYEPVNQEILIYCGNGITETAEDCDGRSGTCSARCEYSGSGDFIVGATASGIGCTSAEIKVGTDSSFCSILTPGLVEEDESATISLKYRNVNFGGEFFPYSYSDNNNYYDSNNNYYSGSGRLLKTETVVVIVEGGGLTPTLVPSNLQPDAIEVRKIVAAELPSSGLANFAILLKNTRDYKLDDLVLLMEGLPSGVTMQQVQPFEIEAGSERTIYFRLQAAGAKEGTYKVKAKLRFDSQTVEKEFDLKIAPESEILKVELEVGNIIYEMNGSVAIARVPFLVRNKEGKQIEISAIIRELPESWSIALEPSLGVIKSGESGNFTAIVSAKEYEMKTYAAAIELRSVDGRRYSAPVSIEFQRLGLLSGLFSFVGSLGALQLFIILAIIVGALYFYSKRGGGGQKSESEERPREGLLNIERELKGGGDNDQTLLIDDKKFAKKGKRKKEPLMPEEEPDEDAEEDE